jgi:hypothetical protein
MGDLRRLDRWPPAIIKKSDPPHGQVLNIVPRGEPRSIRDRGRGNEREESESIEKPNKDPMFRPSRRPYVLRVLRNLAMDSKQLSQLLTERICAGNLLYKKPRWYHPEKKRKGSAADWPLALCVLLPHSHFSTKMLQGVSDFCL